jgi:hypothetical protein
MYNKMEDVKYCKKCDSKKPLTIEHWHKRKSHHTGWEFYCKTCVKKQTLACYNKNKKKWNETTKRNHTKVKNLIYEYKTSVGCSNCSENRHWVIDFHHPDPKKKKFQIGNGENGGWEKNKKEIDKCITLCSNCHRDLHYQERLNK